MVDLGMVRVGEACKVDEAGGSPEIPDVCCNSGDVWLEGVGRASMLEVKSPEDLGVLDGRPRLRGPIEMHQSSSSGDARWRRGRLDLPSSSAWWYSPYCSGVRLLLTPRGPDSADDCINPPFTHSPLAKASDNEG